MVAREDLQSKAAEMVKKALTLGVGAFFLTEESLRGLVSEFKLPKEFLSAILESASRTKSDLMKNLPKELVSQILDRVDLKALLHDIVTKNEIDVHVTIQMKSKHSKAESAKKTSES